MAEGNSKKTVQTKSTNVHNEKADEGDTVIRDKRGDKETIDELPEDDIENLLNLNASDAPTPSTVSSSEGATTPPDGQASEVAEGDEDAIQDGGVLRNDSTDPDMSFEKGYDTTSNRNGFASEGAAGEDASPSNIAVEEERPAPKEIALSKDERQSSNASAVAGPGVGYPKASNEQPGVGAEKSLGSYLDCPSGVPYLPEQSASVFKVSQHQAPVLDKGGECSGRSKSLQHGSTETSVRGETPVAGGTAAASTKGDTLSVAGGTAAASTKGDTLSVAGGTAAASTKGDTLSVAGGTAAASTKGDTLSVAGGTAAASTKGDTLSVAGGTAAASTKGDTLSVAGGTAAASTKGDTLSVAGGTAAASTKGDTLSVAGGTAAASTKGDTLSVAGGTAAASTKGDTLSVAGGTAAASTKGDTLSVAGGTAAASTKGDTLSVAGGTAAASTKGDTLSVAGDDDTPSTAGETVVATTSELPMGPTNHHASFPTASAVTLTSTNVPCYDPAVMNTEPSLSGSNQRPIATPSVSASLPATPSQSMAFPELSYNSTNSDSGLGSVGLGSGSSTGQNSSPLSGPPSGSPEPHSSVLDATPMPSGHRSGIPGSAAMPGGSVVENKSGEDRLLGIATVCDGRTHESAVRVAASLGLPEWIADSPYLIRLMIQSDLLRQCPECVPQAFIARLPHVTLAFECTPSGSIYDRAASLSPSVPLGGPATVSTSRSPQALAAEAVNTPTGRSTFSIVTTTTSSSTCTTTTITTTTASVNATITTTTLSGLPGHTRVFHPQIGARVSSTIVLEDRENLPPQPASGGAFPWRRAPEHQAPIFVPSLGPLLLLRRVMVVVDDEPVADLQSYSVDLANDVVDPSDDRDLPVAGGGMNSLVCFVCLFDFVFALLHHHTL